MQRVRYSAYAQCWERTGKAPLKARWVDIDFGHETGKQMGSQTVQRSDSEEWFAATPLIEVLRALNFTHHERPQTESIDDVRRLSSLLLRSIAT